MRRLRLIALVAAISASLGASDCSSSSSSKKSSNNNSFQAEEQSPAAPMPEPGSALIFGLGALIAATALRRKR